jgi:hypothetical protein
VPENPVVHVADKSTQPPVQTTSVGNDADTSSASEPDWDPHYRMPLRYAPIEGRPYVLTRFDHSAATVAAKRGAVLEAMTSRAQQIARGAVNEEMDLHTYNAAVAEIDAGRGALTKRERELREEAERRIEDLFQRYGGSGGRGSSESASYVSRLGANSAARPAAAALDNLLGSSPARAASPSLFKNKKQPNQNQYQSQNQNQSQNQYQNQNQYQSQYQNQNQYQSQNQRPHVHEVGAETNTYVDNSATVYSTQPVVRPVDRTEYQPPASRNADRASLGGARSSGPAAFERTDKVVITDEDDEVIVRPKTGSGPAKNFSEDEDDDDFGGGRDDVYRGPSRTVPTVTHSEPQTTVVFSAPRAADSDKEEAKAPEPARNSRARTESDDDDDAFFDAPSDVQRRRRDYAAAPGRKDLAADLAREAQTVAKERREHNSFDDDDALSIEELTS